MSPALRLLLSLASCALLRGEPQNVPAGRAGGWAKPWGGRNVAKEGRGTLLLGRCRGERTA